MFLRWKYQKYNLKIPKKAKFGPKPETLLFTKQFDGADFNYSVKFLKFQSINTRKKTLFSTKFIDFSSFCLKLCVLTNSRELISNNGNSFLKLVYKNTQNKHFCSQIWNWFTPSQWIIAFWKIRVFQQTRAFEKYLTKNCFCYQ